MLPAWALQAAFFAVSITASIKTATRFSYMLAGPALGLLLFLFWLLLASRVSWRERFSYVGMLALAAMSAALLAHSSIAMGLFIYALPLSTLMLPAVLWLTRHQPQRSRLAWSAFGFIAIWGTFTLLRIDGFDGGNLPDISWRWSPTAEEKLVSEMSTPVETPGEDWVPTEALWPGFRGAARASRAEYSGQPLDWEASPPEEMWRIPIGPGWSSFAYVSGRLFTQEQRGEQEAVSCYDAETGEVIWMHTDETRFSDVVAGAGPRATPTFADGRIHAFGSKALLTCLDAATGNLVWQRDLMREVNAALPIWGFSSSPLVLDNTVIVYAGGDEEHGLVAYHAETGEPVWQIRPKGMNFSSVQVVKLGDETSVVFGDSNGLYALEPATGEKLWSYKPEQWEGPAICQPQQTSDNHLIVPLGDGVGMACLEFTAQEDGWQIQEVWSSKKLRPSFNDFVYTEGHLFGFDQNIFVCLDAETGQRNWKRGRYGFGQAVLLEGVRQMLVTSEHGELVLLECDGTRPQELGRIPAVEGKTWNHPIVVRDRLFLRNGAEAVCFRL